MNTENGFLLTRQWKDIHNEKQEHLQLRFWLYTHQGPKLVIQNQQEVIFFVKSGLVLQAKNKLTNHHYRVQSLPLKSFQQDLLTAFYFKSYRSMRSALKKLLRSNITPLEADIKPTDRYLMERFITGPITITYPSDTDSTIINPKLKPSEFKPEFNIASFDIETSFTGDQLFSIAIYSSKGHMVLMMGGEEPEKNIIFFSNETALINGFLTWIEQNDPDILIGWNCINFDLRFLQRKCDSLNIPFTLGRNREPVEWRTNGNEDNEEDKHYFVLVPGRAVLDGIDTLRTATYQFESFSLENVGQKLLGRGKLIHDPDDRGQEIIRLFNEDKSALAAYNLEDCKLVWDIFEETDLVNFAIERARLTGLSLDRVGGSVAAFENLYLPKLHRQGYIAPNLPVDPQGVGSPGGYVMDSKPGLYEHVIVLDFKSLYPSIIRSFKVDPYGLAEADAQWQDNDEHTPKTLEDTTTFSPGYRGAYFKKEQSILPTLIERLWHARDEAKLNNNKSLEQSIKIIMSSFYGVMGTPGCRFFDFRLPSSITLRGHAIMNQTRTLIEEKGFEVIYGDTDSLFVLIDRPISNPEANDIGKGLAKHVTLWWQHHLKHQYQLDSALELEYESHYSKFLMPTIRGSNVGTKKRYAGLIENEGKPSTLIFKGLENVRTDWTAIAREFQRTLYELIFQDKPYKEFIRQTVKEIREGKHDQKLIFRKRLRRKLVDYQKNIPPHVQAARKADDWLKKQGRPPRHQNRGWIEYVYTTSGPEPLVYPNSPLDYEIYLERQIAPIVDGIVTFLGDSYTDITSDQMNLI